MIDEHISGDAGVPEVLTEAEVAERYQVAASTVKHWRYRRRGPLWFRAGRHVRYRLTDLRAWEKNSSGSPAS